MPGPAAPQDPRKIATIVWWALLAGLLAFLVVASLARSRMGSADPGLTRLLTLLASGLTVVEVALSRLIPRFKPRPPTHTTDQHALQLSIMASALCVGSGLFCVVVLLITGTPWIFGALTVALVGLVACYPGEARWESLGGTSR
jgi:hypothetical protein